MTSAQPRPGSTAGEAKYSGITSPHWVVWAITLSLVTSLVVLAVNIAGCQLVLVNSLVSLAAPASPVPGLGHFLLRSLFPPCSVSLAASASDGSAVPPETYACVNKFLVVYVMWWRWRW